ncbi:hypothetical protein H4Q26_007311 [Puccinia striiformis f. sp. tritici PST-130]|nr:hypothetical protein H4Q26_007311 [Puccinia striiformis f. sp. tritici PST-130]
MPSTAGASASGTGSSYKPMSYTHLAWSIGHIVVLLSTIWNTLGILFLQSRPKAYSLAYGGAILSWSIVVYKSLGTPSLSKAYLQRAAMDENVQYLVVALYWFFSKPIFVTLLPFAIFSTFHSLSFIRTTFLPKVPSKKDASGAEQPQQVGVVLSRGIQSWVKQNYESAMYCVAFIEVLVIQGRVTLGALTFQNSFLHPLFFAHFLRLRYTYHHRRDRRSPPSISTLIITSIIQVVLRWSRRAPTSPGASSHNTPIPSSQPLPLIPLGGQAHKHPIRSTIGLPTPDKPSSLAPPLPFERNQ